LVEKGLPQLSGSPFELRLGLHPFVEVHELAEVQSFVFAPVVLLEMVCGDSEKVKLTHVVDDLGFHGLLAEAGVLPELLPGDTAVTVDVEEAEDSEPLGVLGVAVGGLEVDAHVELAELEEADLTIAITVHLLEIVFAGSFKPSEIHASLDTGRIRIHYWCLLIFVIITRLIVLLLEVGESFTQPRILPELTPIHRLVLTHIEQVECSLPLAVVRPPEGRIEMHF